MIFQLGTLKFLSNHSLLTCCKDKRSGCDKKTIEANTVCDVFFFLFLPLTDDEKKEGDKKKGPKDLLLSYLQLARVVLGKGS